MKALVLVVTLFLTMSAGLSADILDTPVQCTFTTTPMTKILTDLVKQAGGSIAFDKDVKDNLISLSHPEKIRLGDAMAEVINLNRDGYIGRLGDGTQFYIASANKTGAYYNSICVTTPVKLNYINSDELAVAMIGYQLAGYVSSSKGSYVVYVIAPADITTDILKFIKTVDTKKRNIRFDVFVFALTDQLSNSYGLDFEWTKGPRDANGVQTIQFQNNVWGFLSTAQGKILATLQYLAAKDKLRIKVHPSIATWENETGSFFSGETIYSFQYYPNGPMIISSTGIPVGTSVECTPRIITEEIDGRKVEHIKMVLKIVSSSLSADNSNGIKVKENKVITTLSVLPGETFIVAGLESNEDYNRKERPWLSYLPIIGRVFRKTVKNTINEEIAFLITPRIVDEQSQEDLSRVDALMHPVPETPKKK